MDFDLGDNLYLNDEPKKQNTLQEYQMDEMNDLQHPKWLIRDLLFQQQVAVAYAPPGSFKSFVALDLASRLAHGMEWQGRNMLPCRVVYVAGEGFPMFYNRRLAWFKKNNLKPTRDGLSVVDGAINLREIDQITDFLKLVRKNPVEIGLVIFDTLSTMASGEDENDSAVMSEIIKNAKFIGRELNAAILFIHHPGKDISRGSRGHSSLLGNIDAEWCIERKEDEMGCSLTVTKQKDAEDRRQFHYEATKIALGMMDDDGIEMSSLALSPCTRSVASTSTKMQDLTTIASIVPVGSKMSMPDLIAGFMTCTGKGSRTARNRIIAAVPTTWTRVSKEEDVVEIRYEDNGERKIGFVQVQSVQD